MITILSEQWDRLSSNDPNRLSKELIEYVGLSTDEKPTELIVTGSTFLEADTGDIYIFSEEDTEWYKMLNVSGGESGGSDEGDKGGGDTDSSVMIVDMQPTGQDDMALTKTYAEIENAFKQGRAVIIRYEESDSDHYMARDIVVTIVARYEEGEASYSLAGMFVQPGVQATLTVQTVMFSASSADDYPIMVVDEQ